MTTRITGIATGLDVDTIVKQTMQAYRTKIDTQQQKKDVTEIKQQLYRDIIKESQELYNTHFDVLKSGSLVRAATWQSVKFESKSTSLTVTGDASSKLGNYTVLGSAEQGDGTTKKTNIAKAASISKTEAELGSSVIINGKSFEVTGKTPKEKAINLNNELSKAGINVTVKYTEFAGNISENKVGFLFESKLLGKDNNFTIGGNKSDSNSIVTGKDATGAETIGLTVQALIANAVKNEDNSANSQVSFKINDEEITIDIAEGNSNSDIEKLLNSKLSEKGYTAKIDEDTEGNRNITFITTKTDSEQKAAKIQIKDINTNSYEDIDTTGSKNGTDATSAEQTINSDYSSKGMIINGVYIDLSNVKSYTNEDGKKVSENDAKVEYINKLLVDQKVSIKAEIKEENIVLVSTLKGSSSKIDISYIDTSNNESSKIEVSRGGEDAYIVIKNQSGGFYTYTGITNSFPLDGLNFNFTGDIPSDGIKVESKQDSTEIIDKIKNYIEDYNKLMVKINTLTSEKRDRNYQPLTKEQKEEMSDKEIELWESKVKQGQLRRDSDITRLVNSLKQGMSTMVSGSGLTLEDIGISSVQDYGGTKDGTFKINEATLKEAIENNTEEVSKLFMQSASSGVSEGEAYNQKGIMMRLKDILYDETVSSKSSLAKKVGFEGTTTLTNNTLTKQMTEYQKKIDQMEKLFSTKEQDLYTKYAKLETIMNSYNSQMTYLSQSLGLSS